MDLAFVSPAELYATLLCSSLLSLFLARSVAWFNIETSWVPFDPHLSSVHTRSSLLLASWLVISVCFSLPCAFCPPTSPSIIFMPALHVYWRGLDRQWYLSGSLLLYLHFAQLVFSSTEVLCTAVVPDWRPLRGWMYFLIVLSFLSSFETLVQICKNE